MSALFIKIVTYRIDSDELLKEHDSHTHQGPLPAPVTEAISPRCKFKLEVASTAAVLQVGMLLTVDFFRERNLSTDFTPFPVHS